MQNFINVSVIKINASFIFEPYLNLFTQEIQDKIFAYHFRIDQIRAFTSELIKYYYLPYCLNLFPNQVNFSIGKFGKPFLSSHRQIDFSISHSGEYVIIAIGRAIKIGIDIEQIDSKIEFNALAPMVFSKFEYQQIKTYNDFFLLWTKKEALFKAYGTGFINDYYNTTRLTLNSFEHEMHYSIFSLKFHNYYISLCNILP